MPALRSRTSTHGRNMAGARGLWRATGMKDSDFGKPIVAVVNSFTQFVPGHVHLKDLGQMVAREIEAAGGVAKEFNTIAVDDGITSSIDPLMISRNSSTFVFTGFPLQTMIGRPFRIPLRPATHARHRVRRQPRLNRHSTTVSCH